MTHRQKIIVRTAAVIFGLLAVLTAVSAVMYQVLLPKVETVELRPYPDETGQMQYWVPSECLRAEGGKTVVYEVKERQGAFAKEYYVEAITVQAAEERTDTVRIEGGLLGYGMELVRRNSRPLTSGDTVARQ